MALEGSDSGGERWEPPFHRVGECGDETARCSIWVVLTAVSSVDPSELIMLALERFCCGGLFGGRGSWKMGASLELEGGVWEPWWSCWR